MGSMRVFVTAFLLLASIVATATEAAVSCESVEETLLPCVPYVGFGGRGPIPDSCCNGMRTIKEQGDNPSDRQGVCGCVKSALKGLRPDFTKILASVPAACNVHLQYKIDPSTDCNRV